MEVQRQQAGKADTALVAIATRLVEARQHAQALPEYPGELPVSLDIGYACQDIAIGLWPAGILGWKVGKIPDSWAERLGEDRLVGPIFDDAVQHLADGVAMFRAITGGFAAVEAEFVFRIGRDAPVGKVDWSDDEALALVDALLVGVEFAGSPLPDINRLGPPIVVSDFGNNAGLVLGPVIDGWRTRDEDALHCETAIDGVTVGTGRASSIAGGLVAALRFALARCASRGLPLKAGQYVSTGAATGIHDIVAGQSARIVFPGIATFYCVVVPATAGVVA